MRARIVITEFMDAQAVERLRQAHDVLYAPGLVDDAAALLREAAGADALVVRNRTQVRGDLLQALARCRVVGRLGVGLDNIDVPGCEARGIRVYPATGANAASVAEYVVGTAMLLLRGAYAATSEVAAALREGRLGGAAFDVFGREPLPASPHFQDCPNLLLTPHVAGVTRESNQRVSAMIADRVLEALR